jgi:hypothetical protein
LFTAGLGLAFALVSVCVHDAMSAFVLGRGGENIVGPSGPTAAIALTTAWSIVPFSISLAWLSVRSCWLRVPIGLIAGASPGIAGWLFSWSGHEVITTIIPCLLILALGYRRVNLPDRLALRHCGGVVALVAAGWLIGARLVDLFLVDRAKVHTTPEFGSMRDFISVGRSGCCWRHRRAIELLSRNDAARNGRTRRGPFQNQPGRGSARTKPTIDRTMAAIMIPAVTSPAGAVRLTLSARCCRQRGSLRSL